MKILKIVLLLLVAVSVRSQELDSEFLDSLPDDIRKDIQENNMRKLDGTAEKYSPICYTTVNYSYGISLWYVMIQYKISNFEISILNLWCVYLIWNKNIKYGMNI